MWELLALRSLLYFALVALAFAPLEALLPRATTPTKKRTIRSYMVDLGYATFGAVIARATTLLALGVCFSWCERLGFRDGPLENVPTAIGVPLAILWVEFSGYFYHRLAHRSRWLWKLHQVHHSSTPVDWLASFRQHPLEIVLMTLSQNLPLVLLGLSLSEHSIAVLVLRLNTVFVHTNISVASWPGRYLATPAFHHAHHYDVRPANFASMFPWIDRMFGTLRRC